MNAFIGLHDALRRSKLLDGSVLQPDNFVADLLYDLHIMRGKRKDIGLIDYFTQPSLRLLDELLSRRQRSSRP